MKTYKIANWLEKYENADTRKRKSLFWVLVPNSHDGLGFCSIMNRDDALEVFGAWVLILQVASKCSTRGSLTSTKGQPYTAKDIATITRAPVDSVTNALEVLIEIGWIATDHPDKVADDPDEVADHPDVSADVRLSVVTKKEREKERKKVLPLYPPKGEERGEGSGIVIPSHLADDPAFMTSWASWIRYQENKGGHRWGDDMADAQLEKLSKFSAADAVISLLNARAAGLRGPMDVNHKRKGEGQKTPAPARIKADPDETDAAIAAMKGGNR